MPAGSADPAADSRPPLVLVHGTSSDHTTFRVAGPLLARSRPVFAIDRRGRGASSDGPIYAIEREYEDLAAVAAFLGTRGVDGPGAPLTPVDLFGHSYGGRCALGAALDSPAIRRVVAYEGAPLPGGRSYEPDWLREQMRHLLEAGRPDAALDLFLAEVVGFSPEALAAYHREAVWPARVAAARTILREIEGEASRAASLERLGAVAVPVLLVLGTASLAPFRIATDALAGHLRDVEVVEIDGAAHAAHHTHPAELVAAVERFLDR